MSDTPTDTEKRLVSGWQGRYYEDFEVGDIYKHPYGRTATETDDVWFTNITMNLNPMHFNEDYAARTEFDGRLTNGFVVAAIAAGMSVIDISQNSTAGLGFENMNFLNPVYHGDTIYSESEVLSKRESESRDHVGILTVELRAYNQDDEKVLSLQRSNLILKREYADPSAEQPPGWPEDIGTQPEDLQ
jgi:itaconyl-CoA hydratase